MYVIVGAGVAGTAATESLRRHGYLGPITVVSDEPDVSCFRPALSREYLNDDIKDDHGIRMSPAACDEKLGAVCRRAVAVAHAPLAPTGTMSSRTVVFATDEILTYERLLIATGGRPRQLDIGGRRLDGIFYLRRVAEADQLREALRNARAVLVVGAGPLGLDVAHAALRLGRGKVTVVDQEAAPLASMMPTDLGTAVRHYFEAQGVDFRFGTRPRELVGNRRLEAVTFDDGTAVGCDLAFVAIGSMPAVPSIRGVESRAAELSVDRFMRTDVSDIFCAGEAASVRYPDGRRISARTFHEALEQGWIAGASMAGQLDRPYVHARQFRTRYADTALCMLGSFATTDVVVTRGDLTSRAVFVLRDGALVGAGAFNRPGDAAPLSRIPYGKLFPTEQMLRDPSFDLNKLTPREK